MIMKTTQLFAAAALACTAALPALATPSVKLGVEVLLGKRLDLVKGKRVGLITNVSATDGKGRSDIDLLARAPGVKLTALFAPEHGVRADLDMEDIRDAKDPATIQLFAKAAETASRLGYVVAQRRADEAQRALTA